MKLITILIMLLSTAYAESKTKISEPNEIHSGCDLYITGIESKVEFLKFFAELKAAAATKEPNKILKLVNFPMNVNTSPRILIKNDKDFLNHFNTAFSSKVYDAIAKQEVDQLFCRDQGVMIGGGEVWISQSGKKIGIKSINPL